MARYIWKDGEFVDRKTGEPIEKPYEGQICKPRVISDLPEYRSPMTGKIIDGRAARREDLKRSGCREVDPSEWKGGYKNKRFAEKRGLMHQYEGSE